MNVNHFSKWAKFSDTQQPEFCPTCRLGHSLNSPLFHFTTLDHQFSSVLPLRGALRLRGADAEPAVLLAVDVPPLRRLDAHPRGVPQLEVEGLRVLRVGAEAVVVEVQVLAVLT